MGLVRRFVGEALATAALVAACARGDNTFVEDEPSAADAGTVARRDGSAPMPQPTDGGDPPDAGCGKTVVINEVQTAGASASDEFVELANRGACAVSLSGWKLLYRSKSDNPGVAALYTFSTSDTIAAGAHALIATGAFPGKLGTLSPGMAAADGQVGLLDDQDQLVDGVAYGAVTAGAFLEHKAAPSPPTSGSIARKPDGVDSDDNSSDFLVAATPTPGAAN